MSALSTPGGGGNTTQSKPTSGKQKYQKLDINSLYCTNKNENSEPSSVKSQLSRKHGMQSLGKVPSARRPPANLPSLKTETGQDQTSNVISSVTATVTTAATCIPQTTSTTTTSGVIAGGASAGWVPLPPPSSPHFRTEFPSLEAAAQPSLRSSDHSSPQLQLRPQAEGSWTSGGTVGVRQETTSSAAVAPASTPASQQTPVYRAILPSFLMKGSNGSGLGLGTLTTLRDNRSTMGGSGGLNSGNAGPRQAQRSSNAQRAVDVLTARPILRDDQISSLDDMSRDAGWAQNDDIDYDQKLDFSDGESSAPAKNNIKNNNRTTTEIDRMDSKVQDPGDEDQLWAERRQKQSNEVALAVARARQRKEEEQRRQMRDSSMPQQTSKDSRDRGERNDRDRNDNRDLDSREKDRVDNRDRERIDHREKERIDRDRDLRDKDRCDTRDRDRVDRDRDRADRDRFDNRDRERDRQPDNRDRNRNENRERQDDKERDVRERDRNENRERTDNRDRGDRGDRFDRERDRNDRERDRLDRDRNDRDFRDRDRDYGRERETSNQAFPKVYQTNIPPRFLRQQQNRQQEEQTKGWAFTGKSAQRRQEPPTYNAPRHAPHNGRRSYSRDYSDREDEVRRDKDGSGPQWRSEMQDYERSGRDFDRSSSKDYSEFKEKRNENDCKSFESSIDSSRTAADKLTEVFERKSIGLIEPFASSDSSSQTKNTERRISPPSNASQRESVEKDFGKTSWAEASQEEISNIDPSKATVENIVQRKDIEPIVQETNIADSKEIAHSVPSAHTPQNVTHDSIIPSSTNDKNVSITQAAINNFSVSNPQNYVTNLQTNNTNPNNTINYSHSNSSLPITFTDNHSFPKSVHSPPPKQNEIPSNIPNLDQKHTPETIAITQQCVKPSINIQKIEKELVESESVVLKSITDASGVKLTDVRTVDTVQSDSHKRLSVDDKRNDRFSNEHHNRILAKEPVERKSSGSGSEKKNRGFGTNAYNVYNRGWAPRESRGRRSHRTSRSNNRASESDGSTDAERKERRRAPRSPRGPKKQERAAEELNNPPSDQGHIPSTVPNSIENREPFAPRGQPSRRGRGGFQGTSRPPAPAKRVTGYGPPNTKSPFSQANRVKDNEDIKENVPDDKSNNKQHTSSSGKGRDRRSKGQSGEDENWETTSEHSEGGGTGGRSATGRQPGQSQRGQNRNQIPGGRQNNGRNSQGIVKKEALGDKGADIAEVTNDLKNSTSKKEEDPVDDGFQEVRNKKTSKDVRASVNAKDDNQSKPRSRSNQGRGRNGSSTRNSGDKSNSRGSAPVSGKANSQQYDRPRTANLPPRFVKQIQKQQMGLVSNSFAPDTGAAPPPPPVNAWDKPIAQSLRGPVEELVEVVDTKSNQSSQRSTPAEAMAVEVAKIIPTPAVIVPENTGVLDGSTPPVETIIFENTNYKTPPAEALKSKYQPSANSVKSQEEVANEMESRALQFNGDVRSRPRSIQEIIDSGRPVSEAEGTLGIQMSFEASQKAEDSSDMKLDFAFDSDLGQLTEEKSAKSLGLPRGGHMSTSNTISPLAADLNLKIASVKKVWEMPAVAEGSEELQFAGFEENNTDTGAPPNVCKVKPTQQLQSPPPQHYNHVSYQGGYGGLSVPSPPAVIFNSSQQILSSSQQLQQQGNLYGAFLDQTRGQFGGFPATPYGAGSATPYNYQPPPDMFQSLPSQYRMAAAGGGAAFGQSGQLGNSPSTVLISSTSNSLMSATVKPSSTQQIGAIGSKGAGVGGVGGVGGVNTFQQQFLGYPGPVGEASYSLQGLLPRPAPPTNSYYSPYQPPAAPAPTYPLQFTQPAQSNAFSSQFLSSQLHVAAAVQQMQQQYRAPPLQQQYAPQPRPPPQQQLKSPLHEHANGFAPLCESASPTPKGAGKPQKPPHSPPQHKYHAPPPHPQHPPPSHTPHQHHQHQQHQHQHQQQQHQQHQHQQQQLVGGNNRGGNGGGMNRGMGPPRYPAPIQRPHAPAMQLYRPVHATHAAHVPQHANHATRHNLYYHHQRNGGGSAGGANEGNETAGTVEDAVETPPGGDTPAPAEVKAE